MNLYPLLPCPMKQKLCLVPVFLALTKAAHLRGYLVLLPDNLPHLLYSVLINGKGGQTDN